MRGAVSTRADRRRFEFASQLPDNLQVLASALRAGHSLVSAMAVMAEDAAEPSRTEFKRVVAEERIGVPVDEAIAEVGRRMNSREVKQIALVSVVQAQTGGNTAEILDQVATNVRARFELKRLVRTLTAQGRVIALDRDRAPDRAVPADLAHQPAATCSLCCTRPRVTSCWWRRRP